jgi:hypothetical protein
MITHRSTAYVYDITKSVLTPKRRLGRWIMADLPSRVTDQFRFVVRMAVACHGRNLPYDLTWSIKDRKMHVTIEVTANQIPTPKPLPKPPKSKLVSTWNPTIWDAEYQSKAYHSTLGESPGFVIKHSCGLSLVHPSESGELGIDKCGENEDVLKNWLVIHARSGIGFGLVLNFKQATNTLLLATSLPVDWTLDLDLLKTNPEFNRAGNVVIAKYGKSHNKLTANRKLLEDVG